MGNLIAKHRPVKSAVCTSTTVDVLASNECDDEHEGHIYSGCYLLSLPEELLRMIILHIPMCCYSRAASTCVSLAYAIDDQLLWKRHCISRWPDLIRDTSTNWTLHYIRLRQTLIHSRYEGSCHAVSSVLQDIICTARTKENTLLCFIYYNSGVEIQDLKIEMDNIDNIGPTTLSLSSEKYRGTIQLMYPYTIVLLDTTTPSRMLRMKRTAS